MSGLPPASFGRFEVRLAERRLCVDGEAVALGSRAFDLLAALVERRDRVVPKDELIDVVWPRLVVEENNLQVQISALRKVLGAQAIATVPGRGYRFTLAAAPQPLPATVATTPAPAGRAAAPLHGARLLVADDNKVNRLLLCRSLELMGHQVTTADNGRRALELLRAAPFDLLLLDLEMPELDGFGLLERRAGDEALRDVPVVVTSSLEGAAAVARCIELGADDFLHKPVNPVLLQARVDSSLERKRLRDRQRELLARLAPDLSDASAAAGGARVEATLLAATLHGLDVAQPPRETLEQLGSWATLMVESIEERGGLVVQLAGDAVLAMFDAAVARAGGDSAAAAAVQAAIEMIELTAQLEAEGRTPGRPPLGLGVGIAHGEVVTGSVTTPRRGAYACIGAPARRALQLAGRAGTTPPIRIDAALRSAFAGREAAADAGRIAFEP